MAKRMFELSEQQQAALRRHSDQTTDRRLYERLQAVRLYGEGWRVADICDSVGCSERSLRRWCEQYRHGGIEGLGSGWRGGNNARLSAEARAEVIAKLNQYRPGQMLSSAVRVSQGAFWTVSDLVIGLQLWYGVSYQSPNSYRAILAEANFSLQRTENQYRSRRSDQAVADFEAGLEKK